MRGQGEPHRPREGVLNVDLQAAAEWIGSRFGISPPERKSGQTAHYKKGPTPTLPSRKIGPHKPNAALSLEHFDVYEALLRLLPENSGEEWLQGRGFPPETASGYMIRRIIDPARLLSRLREGIPTPSSSPPAWRGNGGGRPRPSMGPGWYLLRFSDRGSTAGGSSSSRGGIPCRTGNRNTWRSAADSPPPLLDL
jgi:hypothetical protein